MKKEKEDQRAKILYATAEFIERNGVSNVTVRAIAESAGVNIAAINYYFGSKEELLMQTLAYTLDNAFTDPLKELETKSFSPHEMLEFVLSDWLQGMVNYPGISRAHVLGPHIDTTFTWNASERFSIFMKELQRRLKQAGCEEDTTALRMSLVQMISAVMFPALFPELFDGFAKMDFRTPRQRQKYIDHLLTHFLGDKNL